LISTSTEGIEDRATPLSFSEYATTAHDKMVIEAFKYLVVRLPAKGYGTTNSI